MNFSTLSNFSILIHWDSPNIYIYIYIYITFFFFKFVVYYITELLSLLKVFSHHFTFSCVSDDKTLNRVIFRLTGRCGCRWNIVLGNENESTLDMWGALELREEYKQVSLCVLAPLLCPLVWNSEGPPLSPPSRFILALRGPSAVPAAISSTRSSEDECTSGKTHSLPLPAARCRLHPRLAEDFQAQITSSVSLIQRPANKPVARGA